MVVATPVSFARPEHFVPNVVTAGQRMSFGVIDLVFRAVVCRSIVARDIWSADSLLTLAQALEEAKAAAHLPRPLVLLRLAPGDRCQEWPQAIP